MALSTEAHWSTLMQAASGESCAGSVGGGALGRVMGFFWRATAATFGLDFAFAVRGAGRLIDEVCKGVRAGPRAGMVGLLEQRAASGRKGEGPRQRDTGCGIAGALKQSCHCSPSRAPIRAKVQSGSWPATLVRRSTLHRAGR